MTTEALFRRDAYLTSCDAHVREITDTGVLLDRTVFYPLGGGQAGDSGWLTLGDGVRLRIADARKSPLDGASPDDVLHLIAEEQRDQLAGLRAGQPVHVEIDWERRLRHMRLHTASHLMCAILPYPVDGCSITADYARLDFVTTEPLSREDIDARLAELVAKASDVTIDSISNEALAANPELVRTMSVKPPIGFGQVRLVRIEGIDLQPCGGTHVANTAEIGGVRVSKMEKKTARTRRVVLALD
ncbi:alanyl-tRNA editing protein [Pseudomonas sp. PDNC002]|uniref:alanyl-tRNA editing protein n=1 Tax=Pseudomonas sp. PDNC002 TaxID=2811422 RepID=UPI001966399B|nr:alanyl-tRNA editing protein [Pseudomonas sp. PDNC002]QRY77983.1 alanyl-tRNA editing protein [Pseudomonas sp. PDNC002]